MESRFIVQIDETSRDSVSTNASASTTNSTKITRGKNRKYFPQVFVLFYFYYL